MQKLILENKNKIIGQHSYGDFRNLIKKIFKKYRVKVNIIVAFENDDFNLMGYGGTYDSDKDVIELDFFVAESENNTIFISESFWNEFSFRLSQILQHEQIHREQSNARDHLFESRKYKVEKDISGEREYLSDSDEIDAYSHDIALEILNFYKNSDIFDVFSKISRKKHLETLKIYKNAFKNTNWHFIKKKLLKKTYKWVELRKIYE